MWFRNHKRPAIGGNKDGTGSYRASKGLLKLKKKRMWHSWQAYHDLVYDEIWKPIIDVEWDYYITTWKAEHGDAPLTINRFLSAVSVFHMAESPQTLNKYLNRAIEMLPHSLANFANSIYEQTGWVVSFMMGGPTPNDNGQISTLM
jgi:hypothetical protein